MKKNVILLNLNQELEGQIKEGLKDSFVFHSTNQFFDIANYMKKHSISAILADSSQLHEVLAMIVKHYPNVPALVFDNRSSSKTGRNFQKLLAVNSDIEEIQKTINQIISVGELRQKQVISEETLRLQEKWSDLESLDKENFLLKSIDVLAKYLKADNAIWLESGKIDYYMHEMWKVESLNNAMDARGKGSEKKTIYSKKGTTPADVTKELHTITNHLGPDWTNTKEVVYVNDHLLIPIIKGDVFFGYFLALNVQNYDLVIARPVVETLSEYLGLLMSFSSKYTEVKELSYIDDLTELYNQRYLSIALDKCIEQYEKTEECFSVLFMDIDHFKKVNDKRGHLVGSKILHELGHILKQNIRSIDYGFRYGGDEYLLILSNTDSSTAEIVAERIRKQVESTIFELYGQKLQITLSIGIACFPLHAKNKQEVLEMADQAMYYGKHKSRNIVYVAS